MKYLNGEDEKHGIIWMKKAAEIAKDALCLKAKCGTVIVSGNEIIGFGYNAPPLDSENNRTCTWDYGTSNKADFDTTCCMHAEWRAILNALKNNPQKIVGAKLYFSRTDKEGTGQVKKSGKPYCTVCSRFALDVGISHFLLWQEEGIVEYPTDEYNLLSYEYHNPVIKN
jgi:deoxycytidylate deaminase